MTQWCKYWNILSVTLTKLSVKKITELIIESWGEGKIRSKKNNFEEQKYLQILKHQLNII